MHRDPDEQVVGDADAALEPRLVVPCVELHDMLVRHVLDATLCQGVEDALGKFFRDRNRSRDRADDTNLDRIPDAALDEVIVKEERALERRGRALEWVAEDPDQDLPRVEVREHVAHALRSRDRVVLDTALFEAGRGREVVIRPQRDDEDVSVVRGCVCRHLPFLRVDRDHPLLSELDSLFGDVAVLQQDVRSRFPAGQDVQLREPEGKRVVLVKKRDADLAGRDSESRVASSRPAKPAPRITTCFIALTRITQRVGRHPRTRCG